MNTSQKSLRAPQLAEICFDAVYLCSVLAEGAVLVLRAGAQQGPLRLFGLLLLVLGGGDCFHLVPRMVANVRGTKQGLVPALGLGKLITSLTMTAFYALLFVVWTQLYPQLTVPGGVPVLLAVLIGVRIVLCLLPQNKWFSSAPPVRWAVLRNLPFVGIGFIVLALFVVSALRYKDGFQWMSVAIFLSFLFYLPVVLFAQKHPKVGMLMIPKTMAYLWMAAMGLSLV